MTELHIIRTDADVAEGAAWLAKAEPRFAAIHNQVTPVPLRLKPDGFAGLMDIIVSQQVSVASADAIRKRVQDAGLVTEQAVIAAGDEGLRAAGLSRGKASYVLGLALERLDYDALRQMPDDAVSNRLLAIKGIGPWTAQIYVMFCLGRADGFASGDLALQESARVIFDLDNRPDAAKLEQMSRAWSPWRSVAARMLFAYYRVIKSREGI